MDREKIREKLGKMAGDDAGNVAGEKKSAGKKEKGEAQRLSRSEIQRVKETLTEMSPSSLVGMMGVAKSTLTHKQKTFAYNVAMGETKAEAYRKAYKRDCAESSLRSDPYRIASDPRIAREIEAYKLAQEAAKYRTPQDLRNLVIQALTQQVIDPDTPPAVRTQAIKVLGTVTEVAAFTERKESLVHHSSDKLRGEILSQITALMHGQTVEGERIDREADSLLAELTARDDDSAETPAEIAHGDSVEDEEGGIEGNQGASEAHLNSTK